MHRDNLVDDIARSRDGCRARLRTLSAPINEMSIEFTWAVSFVFGVLPPLYQICCRCSLEQLGALCARKASPAAAGALQHENLTMINADIVS